MKREKKYPIFRPEKEYSAMVRRMFSEIASRYDFLNRISSFGFDIYWRKKALTYIGMEEKGKFLDLACGTGDLSFSMKSLYPKIDVFGIDFSLEMLFLAKKKASTGSISFILGDVLHLPFKDESFDALGIAFGLRNIPNRKQALKEMIRVTKKGGKIMILEMSLKEGVSFPFRIYVKHIMPFLARLFSSDPHAYVYLYETLLLFPSPLELKKEMEELGLSSIHIHRFWPGITSVLVGKKVPI